MKKHGLGPRVFELLEFGFLLNGVGKNPRIGRITGIKPRRYRNGTSGIF
jgi:hypothetical protein